MSGNTHRWAPNEFLASLTDPGGPFEVVDEVVLGTPIMVFRQRPPNLPAVLRAAAERSPELPYLVFPDRTLTYGDTVASVARVAARLRDLGVGPGDRVAVASANVASYVVAWWATVSLGGIVSGLNGWWSPTELVQGIEVCAPTLVLADERRLERLREGNLPDGPVVVDLADLDPLLGPARPDDPAPPDVAIDEDDPAIILFTSGTTGRAKGATLSHRSLVHSPMVAALQGAMGVLVAELMGTAPEPSELPRPQPSTLLAAPLFHVSGTLPLVAAPVAGTKVVFPPLGPWDELVHLQLTEEHAIAGWSGVPAQFWRLLEHPRFDEFDTTSIATIGGGGAVFSPELFALMARKLPNARIGAGYGMSETFGSGARLGGITLETHPASVGLVEPLCELEIRGTLGEVLPDGEIGEICVRGASVFLGYWGDPAATAEALDEQRWYRTGDFGRFTDGVLQLESRMRDLIIRGGENVYPIEIETRLAEHPAVAEACVVGVPHHQLGQEIAAVVVLRAGADLAPEDVKAWVADALAAFKVPSYVVFRDELPYNATGKVVKREVEEDVQATLS